MNRETVSTEGAPQAIGPYSQAVRAGGFVFLAGQIALDPGTGELETGGVARQTDRILTSIASILQASGSGLERVVKVTVYMTDLGSYEEMNEVYARYFTSKPPARAAVQVAALPRGAAVELVVTALEGES